LKFNLEEFHIWGKAELEDMLFLPKNDHLLFAYFGLSLQTRKRSISNEIRSNLSLKRKLVKEFGELRKKHSKIVLIRDYKDKTYPNIPNKKNFIKNPRWWYYHFDSHQPVNNVGFVVNEYYAYLDYNTKEWDTISDCNIRNSWSFVYGIPKDYFISEKQQRYNDYWRLKIPENNRAILSQLRVIPYERILAVDEIGDYYNKGPHLLVEPLANGDLFEPTPYYFIKTTSSYSQMLSPKPSKRISYFPKRIPKIKSD